MFAAIIFYKKLSFFLVLLSEFDFLLTFFNSYIQHWKGLTKEALSAGHMLEDTLKRVTKSNM